METKFNFNSAICTSKEQSERLLALGLRKETADMCWRYVNTVKGEKKYELIVEAAWSQEVIDEYVRFGTKIGLFDNLVGPCGKPVTPLEAREDVTKNDIPAWSLHRLIEMIKKSDYLHYNDMGCIKLYLEQDDFDTVITIISIMVKEGHFNKEYLV